MAKYSYIPHLKVLMGGINAFSSQWCGCIFIMCYTLLKLVLLLHETVPLNFPSGTTVCVFHGIEDIKNPQFDGSLVVQFGILSCKFYFVLFDSFCIQAMLVLDFEQTTAAYLANNDSKFLLF